MNCERYQIELEDFLYGELPATRAAEIKAHLASCADCRQVRASLEREAEIFTRYYERTELEPSAAMWEAIREQISGESHEARKSVSWLAGWREWLTFGTFGSALGSAALRQAVFATILIAVSVVATALYFSWNKKDGQPENLARSGQSAQTTSSSPSPGPSSTPKETPSEAPGNNDTSKESPKPQTPQTASNKPKLTRPLTEDELLHQQLARAEREYQNTIQLLDRRIARRKDSLDPAILAHYQTSLALINESIETSRRALRERPKDDIAAQFLLAAYARKVELMEEVAMR